MRLVVVVAIAALSACGQTTSNNDGGDGGGKDGGSDPNVPYAVSTLVAADGVGLYDFDMAVASDGRIGVAYYAKVGPGDAGVDDYALRYVEWSGGQASQPQTITTVQRMNGVDVAFQPSGEPAVTYLGGDGMTELGTPSAFWFQSDAVIARRSGTTWTEEVVTRMGDEAVAGNPVSDRGFLVGINAALAFDGTNTYLAWRDCHDGQFPQQDWNGSDLEFASGSQGAWQRSVVMAGGNDKQAYGGHIQMIIANGQPAILSDQLFGAPEGGGQNLIMNLRNANGTWSAPIRPIDAIGDTQSGPAFAYDATLGFAIAVVDHSSDALYFTRSVNNGAAWSEKQPVFQSGSGGWYPSLSINPESHDPSIAFYICGRSAGIVEGNCPAADDALMVSERIANLWREQTVDTEGGWHPKLAHLPDGKRAVVYRDPRTGAVKVAVEK